MESPLQSEVTFPQCLKFVSHLNLFVFCFMLLDVALSSPVPTVRLNTFVVSPCIFFCTAINFFTFSS